MATVAGRLSAALVAASCMLAACSGEAQQGTAERAKALSPEEARLLGSVNLPRPDWLPEGFPLPADAHIYIAVKINSQPPSYQLQARTLEETGEIWDALIQWGMDENLKTEDALAGREIGTTRVMAISGQGWNSISNVQIQEDGKGVRRMIVTLQEEG